MPREWTEQQRHAITAQGGSILVSAAAGSGKTAVLVERVIRMITAADRPVDADRLLVVTFTRDAAAEMKQRIAQTLADLLRDDPFDPQLLRQSKLLYTATICTIDSFCGDLVKEYFHTLGVSADYRIADQSELELLKAAAMDSAMEDFYNADNRNPAVSGQVARRYAAKLRGAPCCRLALGQNHDRLCGAGCGALRQSL